MRDVNSLKAGAKFLKWENCMQTNSPISYIEFIKLLFMLNSTEHELYFAHKC